MSVTKLSSVKKIENGTILDDFDKIYQLWADIPVLVQLDEDGSKLQHPVLSAILTCLRTGVVDEKGKKRYFLTVTEILEQLPELLKNQIDKPIGKSMLYYYLDILQSMELLVHVYYIEGRHKRKYFGRTAKFFIFGDKELELENRKNFFASFSKFLLIKYPNVTEVQLTEMVEKSMEMTREIGEKIMELLYREEKLLLKHDIDAKDIFENYWSFVPFLVNTEPVSPLLTMIEETLNGKV